MSSIPKAKNPTTFIVFGATGDLFSRKIIPSLYFLYCSKKLPDVFLVVGFARKKHSTESYRAFVFENLKNVAPTISEKEATPFLELFEYQQGDFDDQDTFTALGDTLRARDATCGCETIKSFYLAVPPALVPALVSCISKAIPRDESPRRLIVEKPFGSDESSARELNEHIHAYFKEEEVYRVDHYLTKPALDTLLNARTQHDVYEALIAKETIRGIEVTLFETLGVEKRGAFYDSVGTLKDVGQNHLLEMLALAIMNIPEPTPAQICRARAEFIGALPQLSPAHITKHTIRAQYEGYRDIKGVTPTSHTETYFRVPFTLTTGKHKDVAVVIQSGKRMHMVQKDIVIYFNCDHTDSLHIELEPNPRIYTKKGETLTEIAKYEDPEPTIQYANEYASLFAHAWDGNPTHFPTAKEVEHAWRFIDPVIATWKGGTPELKTYTPDVVVPWSI